MADFLVLESARARGPSGPVKLEAGRVISDLEFDVVALASQGVGLIPYVPGTMDPVVEAFRRQAGKPEPSDGDLTALLIGAGIIGGASPPVTSVFGRIGDVVAAASDYDASQVDNDSGVAGATVADALDTLAAGAAGDVVGPAGATNDAIARFDLATGKLIQNSLVTVNDAGSISLPALETVDGRDVSVDGGVLDGHVADLANPHATDVGNLGSGTLAELNTAITDATLDDSGDPRPPTAGSVLLQKAGVVLLAAFAGNPATAAVVFSGAMADTAYGVHLTALTDGTRSFVPNATTKAVGGFTIDLGTNQTAGLIEVAWFAVRDGETT